VKIKPAAPQAFGTFRFIPLEGLISILCHLMPPWYPQSTYYVNNVLRLHARVTSRGHRQWAIATMLLER
jgi:hypothetical protein